jgi:hypothetical protein
MSLIVPHDDVFAIWKGSDGEEMRIPQTFYQECGTPMDGDSEEEMVYVRTELTDKSALARLVREVIDDVEAVQMTGEEDVRETWPDLWATYELACVIMGVSPKIEPDEDYSQRC